MAKKKETKALVAKDIQKPGAIQTMPSANQAEVLIAQAIQQGTPMETVEKLLAMRKELRAEKAKELFDASMANFQEECPVIEKKKIVNDKGGKERYKYATLDRIVSQVKVYIAKYGLSYSINVQQDEKLLTVVCAVKHTAGHSESSQFSVPIGSEEYMSEVQKYGARLTFAKRYAFCNAFGIMTGDDDNDAQKVDAPPAKPAVTPAKGFEMLKKAINTCTAKELEEYKSKITGSKKYTTAQITEFTNLVNAKLMKLKPQKK